MSSRLWQSLALLFFLCAGVNQAAAQSCPAAGSFGAVPVAGVDATMMGSFSVNTNVVCVNSPVIISFSGEADPAQNGGTGIGGVVFGTDFQDTYSWCTNADGAFSGHSLSGFFNPSNATLEVGGANFTVTFSTPGVKTISVRLTSNENTAGQPNRDYVFTRTITVLEQPTTDFTALPGIAPFCFNVPITLVPTGPLFNPSINVVYEWDFGGGVQTGGTESQPQIAFTAPGTYVVSLNNVSFYNVNDGALLCQAAPTVGITQRTVVVQGPVLADFIFDQPAKCVGDDVTLNYVGNVAAGNDANVVYNWNFVGGQQVGGTARQPIVQWNTPGVKNVTLQIDVLNTLNQVVCSSGTYTQAIEVDGGTADFTVNFNPCTRTATVTYIGSAGLAGASNASFNWNFGVGAVATNISGTNAPQGPYSVVYAAAGVNSVSLTVTDPGSGCTASFSRVFDVNLGPTSSFAVSNQSCFIEDGSTGGVATMTFDGEAGQGSGTTTFQWDLGFGTVIGGATNTASVSARWLTPGLKNVTLVVMRGGCTSTFTRTINFTTLPIADFQVTNLTCFNGGAQAIVTFTGNPGAGVNTTTEYNWNFGDAVVTNGNPAGAGPITLFWQTEGSKVITLQVTRGTCLSAIASQTINVVTSPTGNINATALTCWDEINGGTGSVAFDGVVTPNGGATTTYTWNFDGGIVTGGSATGAGPISLRWMTPGNKNVTLTVANGQCSTNFTKTVTVIEGYTSTFSISNNVCLIDGATQTSNAQIFYTGNAPTAGTTFEWSLDGAVVIGGNPQNPANGFTIAWNTNSNVASTRQVRLRVLSNNTECDSDWSAFQTVNVTPLRADFNVSNSNGCNNQVIVSFNGVAQQPNTQFTWDWNGGLVLDANLDNNAATNGPFLIEYNTNTAKTISLLIQNGTCSDATTQTFVPGVGIALNTQIANFAAVSPVCISGSSVITYQGTSAGPSDSFTWDFNGGNIVSGSGSGPYTISWNSPGMKTITLTVSNTTGCASMIRVVNVTPMPQSDFSVNAGTACRNENVQLTYLGNFGAPGPDADIIYNWNFDGGITNTPIGQDPQVYWNTPGMKTITLQVTYVSGNAQGGQTGVGGNGSSTTASCMSDVFTRTIMIHGASAEFTVTSASLCNNDSVLVTYTGNGAATQTQYNWNFGNAIVLNMSGNADPRGPWSVKFPTNGNKTISLFTQVNTGAGGGGGATCTSETFTQSLQVFPAPTATFFAEGPACFDGDAPGGGTSNVIRLFYTGSVEANPSDPDGIQYLWDFDGGIVSTNGQAEIQDPKGDGVGSNDWLGVRWTSPGTKMISLMVMRGGCASMMYMDTVLVRDVAANFTVSAVNCGASEATVTFTGNASTDALFQWNFAGAVATNLSGNLPQGPYSLKYQAPGTKTVSLTINDNGCSDIMNMQVFLVNQTPTSTFTASNSNICKNANATITYMGNAQAGTAIVGDEDLLVWNFDGGATTGVFPTTGASGLLHTPFTVSWNTPGAKTVTLTVKTPNGECSSSSSFVINVNEIPTSDFNVSDACFGSSAVITYAGNASTGATYTWNFNNGLATPGVGAGPHVVTWQNAGPKQVTLTVMENGCTGNMTMKTINIGGQLTSNFVSPSGTICAGANASLDFVGTAPVGSIYTWNFGGGTQVGGSNDDPTVSWADAGTKVVTLVVTDPNGCTSAPTTRNITVTAAPTASFTANVPTCSSATANITFTGSASSSAVYTWGFGGGTVGSGTGAGPFVVNYSSAGSKTITLSVNDGGCTSAAPSQIITVALPMTGDFQLGSGVVCVNTTRTLTATNYGSNAVYMWNFNGGNQVGGSNFAPQVQWNEPGMKMITLAVAMNNCTTAVTTKMLNVSGPVASFAVTTVPCSVSNVATVSFTGTAGAGATYNWNFGGGIITNNATGMGPYTLNYASAGSKTITLSVALNGCTSGIVSQTISVGGTNPSSSFTAPASACANTNAAIVYTGGAPAPSSNVMYTWNFGDGNVTGGTHPNYQVQWGTPGMKTVTLMVSQNGCVSATTTRFVMVRAAVSSEFTAQSPVCSAQTSVVTYTGNAPANAIYNWNFGTGASVISSSFPNYNVNWITPGTKTISLTVIDGGCTSTTTRTIEVVNNASLSASFTASPATICQNGSTTLTYNGNGGGNAMYTWNFAGGTAMNMSANNDPRGPYSVSWATIGPRTVSLTVSQNGCLSTIATQAINVTQGLNSHFTASSQVCIGANSIVTYNGVAPANATFSWNFAGGVATPGVGAGPHTVSWTTGGMKSVSLFITEPGVNGCISPVSTQVVEVIPNVTANFTVSSPICEGGSATVSYIGNAGPSTVYNWNFDGGLATGNGMGPFVVTWPTNGFKTITLNVQDACNNRTSSQTVFVGSSFTAAATVSDETCAMPGSISASGAGGSGVYSYSIDGVNFTSNSMFMNVPAGNYTVTVKDVTGCSSSVNVMVKGIPGPMNLTVQPASITSSQALATWTAVPGAFMYEVRYKATGAAAFITQSTQNTQFLMTGLTANTNYEVQVRSICDGNRASIWSAAQFQTNNLNQGSCATPIGFFASNVTANSVTLNWTPNLSGAVCYIVAVGPMNVNPSLWSQVLVPQPGNTVTVNSLTPGVEYGARIRTNCSLCSAVSGVRTPFSNPLVNFTTAQLRENGVASVNNASEIKVYPNPNKGVFSVSFDASEVGSANVLVTDVTGRTVYAKDMNVTVGSNEASIDLTGQAAGVYMLRFTNGAQSRNVKVVIN